MNSAHIRNRFFSFFTARKHTLVSSSSLIPAQDPTLLFANAGMNQFKDVFLGKEKRNYTRAVSIQKCVRAGGKHNDLDNVGFTARHLTFFEMMGNFSFGDYFKKEAIEFAWEFLTVDIQLPLDKLHATVFTTDDQSYNIWQREIGLPENRIHRLGAKDNFWQMGETGPCGPCTEIHIDRGARFGCADGTGCGPACDCDRFIELWNLVFMQYDRQPDGSDKPLAQTGVDTGMGLERLCMIAQNADSVYATDLFAPLKETVEKETGLVYTKQTTQIQAAFHVLMDHIRSSALLIADGCMPSNEGRGYVLRKIIRRAALFAQKLSDDNNLFIALLPALNSILGSIYPELIAQQDLIKSVLTSEIEKFAANLVRGQAHMKKLLEQKQSLNIISGADAFKLYDTYGFPLELVHIMAREHGYEVDVESFNNHMTKQQELSGKKAVSEVSVSLDPHLKTEFTGYHELETQAPIIAFVDQQEQITNKLSAGQTGWVITSKSPFFIVGGGQVPDQGWLTVNNHTVPVQTVAYLGTTIGARITTPIDLHIGDTITALVNKERRINAMKNHTATHLLQSALIAVLGKQVKQAGSLVDPDYLRFDFTYHEQITPDQIAAIEKLVNEKIWDNIAVTITHTSLEKALGMGVLAFFGDKYSPENVRVVSIDQFSAELCGGTHVRSTGDIGMFKITEVSALASGLRRIVALTGPQALNTYQETFNTVKTLSHEFKVTRNQIVPAIAKQTQELQAAHDAIKQCKKNLWQLQVPVWQNQMERIGALDWLYLHLENAGAQDLKEIVSLLVARKPGLYFVVSSATKGVYFCAGISQDYRTRIPLKNMRIWLETTAQLRAGGSDTMLQGGGTTYHPALKDWLAQWIRQNQG